MSEQPSLPLGTEDGYCDKRSDGAHCDHWWDGEKCCDCGAPALPGKMMEGDSKYTPLVLSMVVQVYKNSEGKYVVNSKDLKEKVEKMLKKRGLIV